MDKITRVKATDVSAAITTILSIYGEEVQKRLYSATKHSMEDLVKKTKATAPVMTGSFKKNIASKEIKMSRGVRFVWHVKKPDYRITHLIVHGHPKADGGRTKPNPFLKNALDSVIPAFEEEVERVIREGGGANT